MIELSDHMYLKTHAAHKQFLDCPLRNLLCSVKTGIVSTLTFSECNEIGDLYRGGSRTAATSKMELFEIIVDWKTGS